MGIDVPSMALLSAAKGIGVDFSSTCMIGRQNFAGDNVAAGLTRLFKTAGIPVDAAAFLKQNHFCEELFRLLGAKNVESLDVSDYQQATHLHDMNEPIPENLHERYSCVHDGGTIEHVFNISQALKNCLQMLQLGGHFIQVNEANNFMGHGFWQLSPEMIYRAMSPENGFEVRAVLLHEVVPGGSWHLAADPNKVGDRVELCNSRPTYVMTIAQRTAIKEIFATPPQQSDYVADWKGAQRPRSTIARRKQPLTRRVLGRLRRLAMGPPPFNPRHYWRLSEEQVWRGEFDI
jgi:hypothetical protein